MFPHVDDVQVVVFNRVARQVYLGLALAYLAPPVLLHLVSGGWWLALALVALALVGGGAGAVRLYRAYRAPFVEPVLIEPTARVSRKAQKLYAESPAVTAVVDTVAPEVGVIARLPEDERHAARLKKALQAEKSRQGAYLYLYEAGVLLLPLVLAFLFRLTRS